ncbi:MAG: carboxypeptidase-like regulatory domain-containing protein [Candidatus Acidiferrales bacterium]
MRAHLAKLCVLFLFLSGAYAAAAQQAPSGKPQNTSVKDTCSIAGLVVKLGSSEPLKKAHVYLQKVDDPNAGYSTHTDAAGHFAIQKIDPGRYNLLVGHSGYVSQSYGETSSASHGAVLALGPGREIQDLLFRMVPSAVISGRITDEDGDPISDVQVQVMRHYFREGKRILEAEDGAQTNDLGEFRLFGLAKGRYLVRAKISGGWQSSISVSSTGDSGSDSQTGYAPIYYPGTVDQSRATTIEVAPGQEIPAVDFTLIPIRTFHVRGRVFDAVLGQPAKNCMIFLILREPNMSEWNSREGETDCNNGSFQFSDLHPGSYNLVVMLSGSGKRQRSARASFDVDNTNIDDVRVIVGAGIDFTGRILVQGHESLDFSEVRLWVNDPDQFNAGAGAVIKPDGSLTMESVPEGVYQIRVSGRPPGFSPDFYLKSASANGEDILEKGLTVGAGGARGPLEVVLSSAGTRIEGTVTDENELPSAGAVVVLVPEGERRRRQFRLYKDTTTDQYGQFILRGVAPGSYKLFSWKEVENGAWEDPDFLAPFEGKGTKIIAEEDGHASIRLKLIPADKPQQGP